MELPTEFWTDLGSAPAALLALDYDGTLAPFRRRRDEAVPYPGVTGLLAAIREETDTRLVLLSGRPPAEVSDLLGLQPPPEIWGNHGWESLDTHGRLHQQPLPRTAAIALDSVQHAAAASGWPEQQVERKHASLALHWRGAGHPADRAAAARDLLAPYAAAEGLALLEFAAGLELRCTAWDKGRALERIMAAMGPGAVVAYLGDDRTDEDAFAVLAAVPQGLPLLVSADDRPTAARARLTPPAELIAFLERWLATCRRTRP